MIELKSKNLKELEIFISENGFPKYRAGQIFAWLHKGVRSFDEMTNLPKPLLDFLRDNCILSLLEVEQKLESKLDKTVKYLFRLQDGNFIESVVMQYHHGYTICVSSQVGCRMGCAFCQSTKGGKIRDLSAGEILEQILYANRDLGISISNIVMMGIGEPLDNFENVIKFLEIVNLPQGVCIGYRHISLSTCGIVPKIRELSGYNLPITLSISLHAPFDELRSSMMPINRKYSISELMQACSDYQNMTKRRISFEYTLVHGKNDSKECAMQLVRLLKGKLCHVNLIPVNKIENGKFIPSSKKSVFAFQKILNEHGINATVRRTLGADISASCGQLRSKAIAKEG